MSRRCAACGRFTRAEVVLTVYGPLAWRHRSCARLFGMVEPR